MSKPGRKPLVVIMILTIIALTLFSIILNRPCVARTGAGAGYAPAPAAAPCSDGRLCPAPWECCDVGCCAPTAAPPTAPSDASSAPTGVAPAPHPPRRDDDLLKPWYTQWSIVFLLATLAAILLCCLWFIFVRRSSEFGVFYFSFTCCVRRPPASDEDSSGSLYAPPRYSRCGSFHQAPPPYSEVSTKPDLYPLVITCSGAEGKPTGACVVVRYLHRRDAHGPLGPAGPDEPGDYQPARPGHYPGPRTDRSPTQNYLIQAPGSLSATSTAESLNSSFLCNATNEANSLIPPPYSCAGHYEDCAGGPLLRSASTVAAGPRPPRTPPRSRTAPEPLPRVPRQAFRDNLITSPIQPLDPVFDLELELIDCEMYCDGGCKPRLGASPPPPAHRSPLPRSPTPNGDREPYALRQLFPETSSACESPPQPTSPTQSRDSTLTRPIDEKRRLDSNSKKTSKRKSSLYMPLSMAYPVRTSRISPGSRVSSRSAPATPCGALVPNLLNFSQRISSSRGSRSSKCEESNPLLVEDEDRRTDDKF